MRRKAEFVERTAIQAKAGIDALVEFHEWTIERLALRYGGDPALVESLRRGHARTVEELRASSRNIR